MPDALTHMRAICLALPDTKETLTWGQPHFRVGEKIFAGCGDDQGHPAIGVKLDRDHADARVRDDPRFRRMPYVGRHGWVLMDTRAVKNWDEVRALVHESYRLIAPKALSKQVDAAREASSAPRLRAGATPGRKAARARAEAAADQRLWRCPRCRHAFATRNMWHSCGQFDLEAHFADRPAELRAAFERVVAAARRCGPITVYAQKTRIVLQARVRFANAQVRREWLDLSLWLPRRAEHALLAKVEDFGRLGYGLHFHLRGPRDLDAALAALVKEAYEVHVTPPRRTRAR